MKRRDIPARRVTVHVNTDTADRSRPVLERFDFVVAESYDERRILMFLYDVLRRNKIVFDEVRVGSHRIWANEDQLWSRRRMKGCIENSERVAGILEEIYCPEELVLT